MKISELEIKNFRSLLKVSFKELGGLVVLVGENGSGKTNIAEILNLFFNDINVIGGTPSSELTKATSWYGRRSNKPIEVRITIELNEEEYEELFEDEKLLQRMKEKYAENYRRISICRQITKPREPWITKYFKLGGLDLVRDNELVSPDQLVDSLKRAKKSSKIKAYFFHPSAKKPDFSQDRLLVLDKTAFRMDDFADSLVKEKKIAYEIVTDSDSLQWSKKRNIALSEGFATPEDVALLLPFETPSTENLQQLAENICTCIKRFRLIPANRNVKGQSTVREPFIDKSEVITPFTDLATSEDPNEEEKLSMLKDKIRRFVPSDMELTQGKIRVWEKNLRISLSYLGGGQQEIVGIIWQIYSMPEGSICIIEEPEAHLHAKLSRKLFNLLKEDERERQVWIVTHSFIFVDQKDITNNWKIFKKGKQTIVERVENKETLKEILDTMGARPSDRLYPNKVFLACKSEKEFLSTLAKNMGYSINGVFTLLASDLDKYRMKMAGKFVEGTQPPLIIVVDEHGKEVAEQAKKEKWVKEENCFVLEGTIEDYYPKDTLVKVLNSLFNVTVDEKDLKKPMVEAIQAIKGIPKNWKIAVANEVAELMSKKPKTIPTYILEIIKRLAS